MKDRVIRLLQNLSKVEQISMEDDLFNTLKLESVQLMDLTVSLHDMFGVDLGQMAMEGRSFQTVADIVSAIEEAQ
jgi:acyl carrier protein